MRDVFISYSHKDSDIREAVVNKLESAGISCWYAPRDIRPGKEWADTITKALQDCRMVVLIFTENSNTSVQVLREVGLSVDFKKEIIPFKCDDCTLTGSMQYYLSTLHWLNCSDNRDASLDELLQLVRTKQSSQNNKADNAADPKHKNSETSAGKSGNKKSPFSKSRLTALLIALFLIIGIAGFLYSRGIFSNSIAEETAVDPELKELIRQGVTTYTGEDIRKMDFSQIQKWVVLDDKFYYFSTEYESPNADDYLIAMLDDNTIRLEKYNEVGTTEIIIPEIVDGLPVTGIGASCFEDNTEIQKVIIPDTVDFIDLDAFAGCTSLREVTLSNTLTYLGDEAFMESGLVSLTLPESFNTLNTNVFNGCEQLESVIFPEALTFLPIGTFTNTPALKSVTIPAQKVLIDIDAFDADSGVTLIGVPGSYTEKYAQQKNLGFQAYTK